MAVDTAMAARPDITALTIDSRRALLLEMDTEFPLSLHCKTISEIIYIAEPGSQREEFAR